ncbi:hypothetical protein DFH09DRAFT_1109279 [Mycena vulgaris]|nr:hypothetical protein DFH09DRAFT_1109279 [Mycena vulgaris]
MSAVRELRVSASLASSPYVRPLDTLGPSIRFREPLLAWWLGLPLTTWIDSWVTDSFLRSHGISQSQPLIRGRSIPGTCSLGSDWQPVNYLAVIAFTNSTSEGDAALLQILNPGDTNVPFVSLVVGVPDCNTAAFSGIANPSAILAPSDGFPLAAVPDPDIYVSNGNVAVEVVAE